MATYFEKIASVTVGSGGAADIEFTSIPATFDDLVVKFSLRDGRTTSVVDGTFIRFNGDTNSANYTGKRLLGNGSTASSSSTDIGIFANADLSTASTFSNGEIYIPNYAGNTNKSYLAETVQETNATTAYVALTAVLWSNTAAITSIKITPETAAVNFNQHSTAVLYGIKKS